MPQKGTTSAASSKFNSPVLEHTGSEMLYVYTCELVVGRREATTFDSFPSDTHANIPGMAVHNVPLMTLLPTPTFTLAYALPLLFISLVLTFCGCFLALDRTRSFAPAYETIPGAFDQKTNKKRFTLEGGMGGLAIGYSFGLHITTFMALCIPSMTSATSLGYKSFVPVWLLSSVIAMVLAGRWKYCALVFVGILGGTTISLAVCVIIHPALLTRLIITGIFVPVLTLLILLPFPRIQHNALRFATSGGGAFGVVLAIALLADIPAWSNIWERFWLSDGVLWGTAKEKGLCAGFCLFWAAGFACDWVLKHRFGENPDKQWDHYLASFAANLPHSSDRAGSFQPFASPWAKMFTNNPKPFPDGPPSSTGKDVIFPSDKELMMPKLRKHASNATTLVNRDSVPFEYQKSPAFLRKGTRTKKVPRAGDRKAREAIKFGDTVYSSESETEDTYPPITPPLKSAPPTGWLKQRPSLNSTTFSGGSSATLTAGIDELDYEKERAKIGKHKSGYENTIPEYSDYEGDEEDVTNTIRRTTPHPRHGGPGWSPGFLQRHHTSSSGSTRTAVASPGGVMPVPATPSLLRALDRVTQAQQAAYGPLSPTEDRTIREKLLTRPGLPVSKSSEAPLNEGLPRVSAEPKEEYRGPRWQEFWRDVGDKAAGP